jgi:alkanesulfonate monooxygenase
MRWRGDRLSSEKKVSMDIGLHISNFSWPDGGQGIADNLTRVATAAEDAGFTRLSVMDHVWQISVHGAPEQPMLEAYTALGYLAARTTKVELLAWVTAVSYRDPGLLAKSVTTLDVLSNGRAMLGIGAAWNGEESEGLGLFFPPTAERFERLEETLQICLQMWGDDEGPYEGTHYRLGRTLNSPQSLRRPHPPILIGGGGEKKTLRLVAQYAQACNLFARDDVAHKLDVLRQHCADVGRDYDEIEKTVITSLDPGRNGEKVDDLLEELRRLAGLGVSQVHGGPGAPATVEVLELLGERVIPEAAKF